MQANSWCPNYYSFVRSLNLGNVERKEKILGKSEYLKNEKSFLDEMKSIFNNF